MLIGIGKDADALRVKGRARVGARPYVYPCPSPLAAGVPPTPTLPAFMPSSRHLCSCVPSPPMPLAAPRCCLCDGPYSCFLTPSTASAPPARFPAHCQRRNRAYPWLCDFYRAPVSFGAWAPQAQYSSLRARTTFPHYSLVSLPCFPLTHFTIPPAITCMDLPPFPIRIAPPPCLFCASPGQRLSMPLPRAEISLHQGDLASISLSSRSNSAPRDESVGSRLHAVRAMTLRRQPRPYRRSAKGP
jgi:hypothetical protein